MAGRPRKPISVVAGHRTKKEIAERERNENHFGSVPRFRLVPPDELSDRAKRKFNEIAGEAFWLDELSADILAAYCLAWDRWLDVAAAMRNEPDTYMDADGKMCANPNRRALLEYQNAIVQASSKLGLGNIDRLKLVKPAEEKPKSRFASFLEENA